MLGVCCTCQETHLVRPSAEAFTDLEDDFCDLEECGSFVMDYHEPSFGGGRCKGTGTTPQAIVRE